MPGRERRGRDDLGAGVEAHQGRWCWSGCGAWGTALWAIGTHLSATGLALAASASAFLRALMPPTTNMEASIGRASSLVTVMAPSYTMRGEPPVTRLWAMCGRYASSRQPEDLIEEFEVVDDRTPAPLAADYNVAPTKEVYAVVERPPTQGQPRAARAPAAGAHVGAGPVVGQGPLHRQPDDQRADGDGRREARLQAGLRRPALPAAGRRLLRVVSHLADQRQGQAGQAALLHPARRRRRPGDGRALRDLARPDAWPTTTPTASGGPARCSPPRPRTRWATSTTGCR